MIPAQVAIALRADGWYLRQDIIWAKAISGQKEWLGEVRQAAFAEGLSEAQVGSLLGRLHPYVGSCMPEGPTDRFVRSHEYLFLLTKAPHYYFDWMAVEEDAGTKPHAPGNAHGDEHMVPGQRADGGHAGHVLDPKRTWGTSGKRRRRSVWIISRSAYEGAHYASFPGGLVELPLLAGTSEKGCCSMCGAPWRRRTKREGQSVYQKIREETGWSHADMKAEAAALGLANRAAGAATGGHTMLPSGKRASFTERPVEEHAGWVRGCAHTDPPVPCTVLDPFFGSGTTGQVARELGRRFVGIELNEDYVKLAWEREDIGGSFRAAVIGEDEREKVCPKCGRTGRIGEVFGWRYMAVGKNGTVKRVRRVQSWCRMCRGNKVLEGAPRVG